jgi:predicted kinase
MADTKPTLLLMAGLPGSGKSTLANAVGLRLAWPVIDKDTIKSGLLEIGASEAVAAKASYTLLHDLARDIVMGQGLSVILDTPSSYNEVVKTCTRIAAEAEGVFCIVLCEASDETRSRRLAARKRRRSHVAGIDAGAEAVIKRRFKRLPQPRLHLSTEGPSEDLVDEVVSFVFHLNNVAD